MTIEQIERGKCIVSCINSADENIAKLQQLQGAKEVGLYSKDVGINTIYVTGNVLKDMIQVDIDHWQKFKDKHEKELAEL